MKKNCENVIFFYFVDLSSFTSSLSSSTNLSRLTGHDDDVDDDDKIEDTKWERRNIKINENDNHVDFDFEFFREDWRFYTCQKRKLQKKDLSFF